MKRGRKIALLFFLFCLLAAFSACSVRYKNGYRISLAYDGAKGTLSVASEGLRADGLYSEGSEVTVTVSPAAGYFTQHLLVNGETVSLADGKYTFSVKEDTEIEAEFAEQSFSVTLAKDFGEDVGSAWLSPPQNGSYYTLGEEAVLFVQTAEDGILLSVLVGGKEVSLEDGVYRFPVLADTEIFVSMRAAAYYSVTLSAPREMGGIVVTPSPAREGKYREGTLLTAAVRTERAYVLSSVTVNGEEAAPDEEGKFSFPIWEDVLLEAHFAPRRSYSLTVELDEEICDLYCYDEYGRETPIGTGSRFYEGEEPVLTVRTRPGYRLLSVTVDGEPAAAEGNSFCLTAGKDCTVEIVCGWSVPVRDDPEGDYPVSDERWYAFSLKEPTLLAFFAKDRVRADFFRADGLPQNAAPLFGFDGEGAQVFSFETGEYCLRLCGDGGVLSSVRLPVTNGLAEGWQGDWKSEKRSLSVGENFLCFYDGEGIFAAETEIRNGECRVLLNGERYDLSHCGGALCLSAQKSGEREFFLPDPLPEIALPEELYGNYRATGGDELVLSHAGARLNGAPLLLLGELSASPAAYAEGELYLLSLQRTETGARLLLALPEEEPVPFFFEGTAPQLFSEGYLGLWECGELLLGIGAGNVSLTDGGGEEEIATGAAESKGETCPTLTFGGNTYFASLAGEDELVLSADISLRFFRRFLVRTEAPHARVVLRSGDRYARGSEVSFTVTSEEGYILRGVTVNGEPLSPEGENYRFRIEEDVLLAVRCSPSSAAETPAFPFESSFFGVWGNGEVFIEIMQKSVRVTDSDGYGVEHVLGSAVYRGIPYHTIVLGGTEYLFYGAGGSRDCLTLFPAAGGQALYLPRQYRVELRTSGRGTASLSPAVERFAAHSTATVLLSPEEGYTARVTVNGEPLSARDGTCRFSVTEDATVEVVFEAFSPLPPQAFSFPERFRGEWRSADGAFSLSVGESSFVLKKGNILQKTDITAVADGEDCRFFAEYGGRQYELETLSAAATSLALFCEDGMIAFVPSPLPEIRAGKSLYQTYKEKKTGGNVCGKEIVISEEGFYWGEDEVFLLGEISKDGETPTLVLAGGRVYALFVFSRADFRLGYDLVLRDLLTGSDYEYEFV